MVSEDYCVSCGEMIPEGRQEEERNRPSRNYFNSLKWRNRK